MKENKSALAEVYLGVGVVVATFTSIGVWHWYKESNKPVVKNPDISVEEVKEKYKEPELVVCFPWADDNIKKGYPIHWGPEPQIQTKDYRKLPEPFGMGSGTLYHWIKKNQEQDAKNSK